MCINISEIQNKILMLIVHLLYVGFPVCTKDLKVMFGWKIQKQKEYLPYDFIYGKFKIMQN